MAAVLPIAGTGATAKVRNPLGVIGLTFITLGIYYWVWYYKVNREMKDLGAAHNNEECGTSPGTSLLAVTFGAFIIVPPFVSIFRSFKRLNASSQVTGAGDGFDAGLGLLLWLFISPVAMYIFQMNLNKVWLAQNASPAPAIGSAPEAPAAPAPVASDNAVE
jgi:hypothetical protein